MSKRDFYDVLGVEKGASKQDIRKAYRTLARKYHPDVNKADDAEAKFIEAKEAYETLSNEQKKAQYDQFGHAGAQSQGFGGGGEGFSGGGFGDIFDMFFGGGGRGADPNAPQQGSDLQYRMVLEFEEAIFGKETEITLPKEEECETCDGSGAKPGTKVNTCSHCDGSGQITVEQNTPFGRIQNRQACNHCGGSGQVITEKCTTCRGAGRVKKQIKVKISIPAGIDEGQQIRMSGKGEAGVNGGPPGDLYVVVQVKPDGYYEREGDNIFCELPLTFSQAALGEDMEVPTVHGKVRLKIPAGTQAGKVFRLRGKGVPNVHGRGQGDQHIQVKVITPQKLSSKQKELLKEFDEIGTKDKQGASFFDRFKKAFKGE